MPYKEIGFILMCICQMNNQIYKIMVNSYMYISISFYYLQTLLELRVKISKRILDLKIDAIGLYNVSWTENNK